VSADVPAELEAALRPLITAIQTLNEQIRCCDMQIETLARETSPQTFARKKDAFCRGWADPKFTFAGLNDSLGAS
jgi:hypothetical protein